MVWKASILLYDPAGSTMLIVRRNNGADGFGVYCLAGTERIMESPYEFVSSSGLKALNPGVEDAIFGILDYSCGTKSNKTKSSGEIDRTDAIMEIIKHTVDTTSDRDMWLKAKALYEEMASKIKVPEYVVDYN